MNKLTCEDIVAGLRDLGLQPGDRVLVHSSLVALGQVEGGPETVIDALLECVGADGLVVVPTFACAPPFDRHKSPTPLGAIPDKFWRRPNAVRSLHPTHSVAAIGKGAEGLIKDHEKAQTAYGLGTPYHTLATTGGKVLLMGVDQDRNTTLHTAEALAGAAYLTDIEGTYIDDVGNKVTIPIAAMAGPHRDFIGLDRILRDFGIVKIGRIGGAVCRLMDAGDMLQAALGIIEADPAAVLCDNPACADCVMQRGRIKAARLTHESFTLAAVAGDISDDPAEVLRGLHSEGVSAVELTTAEFSKFGAALMDANIEIVAIRSNEDNMEVDELADSLAVPIVYPVSNQAELETALRVAHRGYAPVLVENTGAPSSFYEQIPNDFANAPKLAFSPRHFAAAGEKPFLGIFYRGKLRKQTEHFYIDDGTLSGESTLPGRGNGEVKEIISMLRCRSYDGVMTLRSPLGGADSFCAVAAAFWSLLDTM